MVTPSCHTEAMTGIDAPEVLRRTIEALRSDGVVFAFLHGSATAAATEPRTPRDMDVGAWWRSDPPQAFDVALPPGVDLTILNTAPLELAVRIAAHGQVLFDDDPARRVRWQSTTRKIYFDELPRLERSHREFAEGVLDGR